MKPKLTKLALKKSLAGVQVEKTRAQLVFDKDYENLQKTYSKGYREIVNLNTGRMWDDLNAVEIKEATNPMAFNRIKKVASLINEDGVKVLDIGFGPAALEKNLSGKNNVVVRGIDISKKSVQAAKKKFPQWKFEVNTVQRSRFPKDGFDYVVALEFMEHIRPSQTFSVLNKIYKALKIGGYFIVSVPLNEGLEEMIKRGENPNAHIRIYSPQLISWELEHAGFEVLGKTYLYAFYSQYYLKTFIVKLLPWLKHPNNVVLLAKKA